MDMKQVKFKPVRLAAVLVIRRTQRGVSLIFALMGLVVLTLGAVALLRSVDTGLMVLGNLGFKQDALSASSAGTEAAITWLQNQPAATLAAEQRAFGYYPTAVVALEVTGPRADADAGKAAILVDWTGSGSCANAPGLNGRAVSGCLLSFGPIQASGGNTVRYVITRLCAAPGLAEGNDCLKAVVLQSGTSTTQRGSLGYGSHLRFVEKSAGTYYRIIARAEDKRGTVSYSETLVHF
jgi:Tfp pilus assembly protein PilX